MNNGAITGVEKLRRSLGLSQEELAELCGVNVSSISRYERRLRKPGFLVCKQLLRIAALHEIDMTLEDM